MDIVTYALLKKKVVDGLPDAVDDWLSEHVDPDTGYVLDRTLTQPNAAAPADLVGEQSEKIDNVVDYKVVNGIDDTDFTPNGYWNQGTDGSFVSLSGYRAYNKYVQVEENKVYSCWLYANGTFTATSSISVCWYDDSKAFMTGKGQAYRTQYTSPDGAKYVRFSSANPATNTKLVFTEGENAPTEYNDFLCAYFIQDDVLYPVLDNKISELEENTNKQFSESEFDIQTKILLTLDGENSFIDGCITGELVWYVAANYSCLLIPVNAGDVVVIQKNKYRNSYMAFLSDQTDYPKTSDVPAFASGSTLTPVAYTRTFTVANDAKYLYVHNLFGGVDYLPSSIKINDHEVLGGVIADLSKNDNEINLLGKTVVALGDNEELSISNDNNIANVPYIEIDGNRKPIKYDKILAINHDDLNRSDFIGTRNIYAKYGFNGNFNFILNPFATVAKMKETVNNVRRLLKDGNELGFHAYFSRSCWWGNSLFDVRPDGTFTFAPTLSEIKGDNPDGTGTNSFGDNITASTKFSDIGFEGETATVADCTSSGYTDIIKKYCVYYINNDLSGVDLNGDVVTKGIMEWAEYWYNNLIDSGEGYSESLQADYSIPENASIDDYYPDETHLLNGKMVYWNDIGNAHYSDSSYQKVGKFTKGLFKGCFSCCNFEVTDKIIRLAEAFCRHYFGMVRFTNFGRHGQGYVEKFWTEDGFSYENREKTVLVNESQKLYRSHLNKTISNLDVLLRFGIKMTNHYNSAYQLANLIGQVGLYHGQNDIRGNYFNACIYPYGRTTYLSLLGYSASSYNDYIPYDVVAQYTSGKDNLLKWAYEKSGTKVGTTDGRDIYVVKYIKEALDTIRATMGTRKIPCLSLDTLADSPNTMAAVDLLCRFCYENDIKITTMEEAREYATIKQENGGNLMPNPAFNQMLLNYFGGDSDALTAFMPDGWSTPYNSVDGIYSVATEEISGKNVRVFSFTGATNTGSVFVPIYGLQGGKYKFTCKAKTTGSGVMLSVGKVYNSAKIVGGGSATVVHDIQASADYTDVDVEIDIENPVKIVSENTPEDIICNGYANNVAFVKITLIAGNGQTTKIAEPRFVHIN